MYFTFLYNYKFCRKEILSLMNVFLFCSVLIFWQVSEMAVSELPGNPNAVWTVKKNIEGKLFRRCINV